MANTAPVTIDEDRDALILFFTTRIEKERIPAAQKTIIRGNPIPDHEVDRGARVTRKARQAEMDKWGVVPELAGLVDNEKGAE